MNKVKLKDRYIFPAIFQHCDGSYTVTFPDLPGCITEGSDIDEALKMAKEAMELHIYNMEDDKEKIPTPSKPESIKLPKHSFTSLIEVWMPPVRNEMRIYQKDADHSKVVKRYSFRKKAQLFSITSNRG
jgi:predicted RNase H-like HicB family nuclease